MGCSRPLDTYYQVGLLAQIGNKKRHLKTYLPSILLHIHWWLNVLYHVTQHFKMAPFRTLLIFCVEKTEIVQMPWCSKWCSATLNTTKASCKIEAKTKTKWLLKKIFLAILPSHWNWNRCNLFLSFPSFLVLSLPSIHHQHKNKKMFFQWN